MSYNGLVSFYGLSSQYKMEGYVIFPTQTIVWPGTNKICQLHFVSLLKQTKIFASWIHWQH